MRMVRLALLAWSLLGLGCVSAGWDSETVTVVTPETVVKEYDPALGKLVKETISQPVTRTTRRRASFSDTTGAGKIAGGMLEDFGGLGGILGALGPTGLLGTVLGGGGLLGFVGHWIGSLRGERKGYGQAQMEMAGVPALAPPRGRRGPGESSGS